MTIDITKSFEESISQQAQILSSLMDREGGDPKFLQRVSDESIREYVDFLIALSDYKQKIKEGIAVTKEERAYFGPFLEDEKRSMPLDERDLPIYTARFSHMKDIAYHKYLWMTRGKMPGYEYAMDHTKDRETFEKRKRAYMTTPYKVKGRSITVYDVYMRSVLDIGLDMEDYSSSRFYKHTIGFDGLDLYLEKAENIVKDRLSKEYSTGSKRIKTFLLELRYMYEVADATHDVYHKRMLAAAISFHEEAIKTMEEKSFTLREERIKRQRELQAILKYCSETDLTLEDLVALKESVEKMKTDEEMKDKSIQEITKQMEQESVGKDETIKKQQDVLQEILTQATKTTFGGQYKISKQLFEIIQQIVQVEKKSER